MRIVRESELALLLFGIPKAAIKIPLFPFYVIAGKSEERYIIAKHQREEYRKMCFGNHPSK